MAITARIAATLLALTLTGAAQAADRWATLDLAPGRAHYTNGYRPVVANRTGDIVTVSGLLKTASHGHLVTLPSDMRPAQHLIFNVNVHDDTARVDVYPDGKILMAAGNTGHGWVSLDGIAFAIGKGHPLALTSGWHNYGGGYAGANAVRVGETVYVGGLVKPGSGDVIATLPADLRPTQRLIFNLNSHDKTSRVDVLPDGRIVWVYRAPARGWVSLDGISFERKPGKALHLTGGWRNWGDGYAPATVTRTGQRVSVSGVIRAGTWGHVATLPQGLCPESRLIFNLSNHERTARVDVLADCRIIWNAGGRDHGWLSLEGIAFERPPASTSANRTGPVAGTGGGLQAPAAAKRTATGTAIINAAKSALGGLGEMAGPMQDGINQLINAYNHLLVEDGELLHADIKVLNQTVTIVIYRPIHGQPRVNFAVMTRPGQSLKVSNIIAVAGGTPADDLQLANVAYIFVPNGNAQDSVTVNSLPGVLRTQVSKVRTGAIEMLAGQNIFATINTADNGATAKLLKLVGVSLGDLDVHIGYGRRANNDPFKAVRMTRAGNWNKPFHLSSTVFTDATLDLSQWGNVKRLRGWGTATLHDKPYFLFVQKTGTAGPYPTAASIDAKSVSLSDYRNIALVLGETVFGSLSQAEALMKGLDSLPLDEVRIENPDYRPGGALDADNNPVFNKVMIMAASPADTLPDAGKTKGPVIVAHGRGSVFGIKVGKVQGMVTRDRGMDVRAEVTLPKWGGMELGNFKLALSRGDTKTSYDMYLRGKASIGAGPVTFSGEDIEIQASRRGFTFEYGQMCPRRPVGVSASVNTHRIGHGGGFHLSAHGDPMKCILDIGKALDKAAGAVANVSRAAYDKSQKEIQKEIKDIGKQAEKAAKWVGNKISGLFGRKKKKKPSKPSYEELRQLECGKGEYPGYVLWHDECPRNWADRQWKILAKQSSDWPDYWYPCATQEQVKAMEKHVANQRALAMQQSNKSMRKMLLASANTNEAELKTLRELAKEKCVIEYRADKSQDRSLGTPSLTRNEKNPWWEIDLGKKVPLHTVVVHGRNHEPAETEGLIVAVSATVSGERLMWDQSDAVKRFVLSRAVMSIIDVRDTTENGAGMKFASKFKKMTFTFKESMDVRYVRIYRPGQGHVGLAEVQLFGPAGVRMHK